MENKSFKLIFLSFIIIYSLPDFQTDDDIRRERIECPTIRPIPLFRVSISHIIYIVRKKARPFKNNFQDLAFCNNMIGELDLDRCLTSTDENPLGSDQLLDLMILADRFEMDSLKVPSFYRPIPES